LWRIDEARRFAFTGNRSVVPVFAALLHDLAPIAAERWGAIMLDAKQRDRQYEMGKRADQAWSH